MADRISVGIYSMNARGLKDENKRAQVFSWLQNRNAYIYFLQETHSTLDCETTWKENWGNNDIIFSHGTSNSRGDVFFLIMPVIMKLRRFTMMMKVVLLFLISY